MYVYVILLFLNCVMLMWCREAKATLIDLQMKIMSRSPEEGNKTILKVEIYLCLSYSECHLIVLIYYLYFCDWVLQLSSKDFYFITCTASLKLLWTKQNVIIQCAFSCVDEWSLKASWRTAGVVLYSFLHKALKYDYMKCIVNAVEVESSEEIANNLRRFTILFFLYSTYLSASFRIDQQVWQKTKLLTSSYPSQFQQSWLNFFGLVSIISVNFLRLFLWFSFITFWTTVPGFWL